MSIKLKRRSYLWTVGLKGVHRDRNDTLTPGHLSLSDGPRLSETLA